MMNPPSFFDSKRHSGAALVIVLSILLLVVVLVIGFFAASVTETQSAVHQSNLSQLRRLRELPLEIVKTQILNATTLGQTGNSPANVTNTWTSQPGLLRVFNTSGQLVRAFKLYSSATMEEDNASFISTEIPDDWDSFPNRYVNLNQPFPSPVSPNKVVYPILNPQAVDWAEGLEIEADPAGQTHATMPVEWLYFLEDGQLVPQSQITEANPPVARIAFWTDDESCKVNINTAGERTFWDRPRAGHHKNYQFRYVQPSTGEYNAYPGHPATVSLSAVFHHALSGLSEDAKVEKMLHLTPRYQWGGSQNNQLPTYVNRTNIDPFTAGSSAKKDRLFASTSEFLINTSRDVSDPQLAEAIRESGFLLTESSRSPELNLFGMPKVGLWPIDGSLNGAKRTPYDRLIGRGTTIGQQEFFFQRINPLSTNEAQGIAHNWKLLQYLDTLTSLPVPGFGGTFSGKYTQKGNRQILTEMFDYIRAGVNLSDPKIANFADQFTPADSDRRGYVLPTRISNWNTRGFGRLPVITNVGLVLYAYGQRGYEGAVPSDADLTDIGDDLETDVHMMLWFNFINPMVGVAPVAAQLRIEIKSYTFGLKTPGDPNVTYFTLRGTSNDRFTFTDQGKDWGGYESMIGHASGQVSISNSSPLKNYEFHSENSITIVGPSMDFIGGELELEVYDNITDTLLQKYILDFPSSTNPWLVPLPWQQTTGATGAVNPVLFWERNPGATKDSDQTADSTNYILGSRRVDSQSRSLDVIRGIELKHGDARIVSCMDQIPESMFQPAKGYFDGNRRVACSLLYSRNISNITRIYEAEFGKHVDVRYHDEIGSANDQRIRRQMQGRPPIPAEVGGVPLTSFREMGWSGDIDAGMLHEPDGPFLNKPDEGFIATEDPAVVGSGRMDPYVRSMSINMASGVRIRSWDPRENAFFSPTRQMPSAIQFGSLPSGVLIDAPWRTLVFSPNSQAAMVADKSGNKGHPGAESPHDYLYLDLFTMPVVEPYAISEPFSTAGKINLNQQLVPFAHIRRETGLYAVLKHLEMAATESTDPQISAWYKSPNDPTAWDRYHLFRSVNVERTVDEIAKVWATPAGVYRSASQICDVFLITNDMGNSPEAYWATHQLTADNVREAPYNYIYPLLTTKSNTYQVHYRVQTLTAKKNPTPDDPDSDFDPTNAFTVTGEQRGSYVLERYLDVNDPRFEGNDPEVDPFTTPLNEYYKFRVLRHTAFTPGS